jgi:hypothetical protein
MKHGDVSRRLAEIRRLFRETAGTVTDFDAGSLAIPPVGGITEPVESFGSALEDVEKTLTRATKVYAKLGGLSPLATGAGSAAGVREEVRADVRALANLALGLTPPSVALVEILSELETGTGTMTPPSDDGPVPFPPLRVAASVIAQADELLPMHAAGRARELFGKVSRHVIDKATVWLAAIAPLIAVGAAPPSPSELDELNTMLLRFYNVVAAGTNQIYEFIHKYNKLAKHGPWEEPLTSVTSSLEGWVNWWWYCDSSVKKQMHEPTTLHIPKALVLYPPDRLTAKKWFQNPTGLPPATAPSKVPDPNKTAQTIQTSFYTLRDLLG